MGGGGSNLCFLNNHNLLYINNTLFLCQYSIGTETYRYYRLGDIYTMGDIYNMFLLFFCQYSILAQRRKVGLDCYLFLRL
jgi:hypothetical protein